jgi:hypothetical protein
MPYRWHEKECYGSEHLRAATAKITALLCLLAASGCWSRHAAETGQLAPELTLERVRFQIDRVGESRATGQAGRVTYRRDTTEVAATDLDLVLSGAEGPVRLQAPEATGVTASRHFRATGGVTATRGQDVAVTAAATYDVAPGQGRGQVRGVDPVHVSGPGYRLDGQGFTLDPATSDIVLLGGAKLAFGLPVRR